VHLDAVVWDPAPAEFRAGLVRARTFLERHAQPEPVVTINAWNEWDLEQVLEVFEN
jgi:hypothetical protein